VSTWRGSSEIRHGEVRFGMLLLGPGRLELANDDNHITCASQECLCKISRWIGVRCDGLNLDVQGRVGRTLCALGLTTQMSCEKSRPIWQGMARGSNSINATGSFSSRPSCFLTARHDEGRLTTEDDPRVAVVRLLPDWR
jgi:hypothetical protein